MPERRMFAKTIVDSDAFLDMPHSAQSLYFHLGMRADDDGFINNPKKIARMLGCGEDDLKILFMKKFIIGFETGVIVIKHWRMHNYIQNDRYKETVYQDEKSKLFIKDNGSYTLNNDVTESQCIQPVYSLDTQVRLGKSKDRLSKVNEEKKRFSPPTIDELNEFIKENQYSLVDPQRFIDYYTSVGWRVGRNPMKDWKAAVRQWNAREKDRKPNRQKRIVEPIPDWYSMQNTEPKKKDPLTDEEIDDLKKTLKKFGASEDSIKDLIVEKQRE